MLSCLTLTVQQDCELKKDKDGIKVYSKPDNHSGFNELKVETTLSAGLSALAALILDIDNYPNWSFNTEKSYLLKKVSPSELYFYTLIHSPWPATDRDLPIHLRLSQDAASKVLSIQADCIPDYIPPNKDIVRVPLSIEQWTVTPLTTGRIHIEYRLRLDPGASVPAWLINSFAVKGPFETFTHLREQIQKSRYQKAEISFIRD